MVLDPSPPPPCPTSIYRRHTRTHIHKHKITHMHTHTHTWRHKTNTLEQWVSFSIFWPWLWHSSKTISRSMLVGKEERWGAGVETHFQEISWNLRPVVNGTKRRGVGFIKWYSTPSPNLSPYIFLGLDPSPTPLERKDVTVWTLYCHIQIKQLRTGC